MLILPCIAMGEDLEIQKDTIDSTSSGTWGPTGSAAAKEGTHYIYNVIEDAEINRFSRPSRSYRQRVRAVTFNVSDGVNFNITNHLQICWYGQFDAVGNINLGKNSTMSVGTNIEFNIDGDEDYSTTANISLEQGAKLSAKKLIFEENQPLAKLNISGMFGVAEMNTLTDSADGDSTKITWVTTDLITLQEGITGLGTNQITLSNIDELDDMGFSNKGVITDTTTLGVGEYGLYYSTSGLQLVAAAPTIITVPEPTTATLSLLALAGLAARRRRS